MEVWLIDDHKLFLEGLRHSIGSLPGNVEVSISSSFDDAQKKLPFSDRYDLILMDLNIDGGDGVALLLQLQSMNIYSPVVAVSASEDINHINAALCAGAAGFIPKSFSLDQMILGLEQVLAGDVYIPPLIKRQLKENQHQHERSKALLTKKQTTVLSLLCEGLSNRQIAERLFLTEHTVKSHLLTLYQKLGVNNRTECVLAAQKKGLNDQAGSSQLSEPT